MDSIIKLLGQSIPSVTGRVWYEVLRVEPGARVVLGAQTRARDVVLPWSDIEAVYDATPLPRPSDVPAILGKGQYRKSSPLCALVRAARR